MYHAQRKVGSVIRCVAGPRIRSTLFHGMAVCRQHDRLCKKARCLSSSAVTPFCRDRIAIPFRSLLSTLLSDLHINSLPFSASNNLIVISDDKILDAYVKNNFKKWKLQNSWYYFEGQYCVLGHKRHHVYEYNLFHMAIVFFFF